MTTKDKGVSDALLREAIAATREVMNSSAAPPTAKASAVSSALAIHRLLNEHGTETREPSEMSYEEIQASIEQLRAEADERRDSPLD